MATTYYESPYKDRPLQVFLRDNNFLIHLSEMTPRTIDEILEYYHIPLTSNIREYLNKARIDFKNDPLLRWSKGLHSFNGDDNETVNVHSFYRPIKRADNHITFKLPNHAHVVEPKPKTPHEALYRDLNDEEMNIESILQGCHYNLNTLFDTLGKNLEIKRLRSDKDYDGLIHFRLNDSITLLDKGFDKWIDTTEQEMTIIVHPRNNEVLYLYDDKEEPEEKPIVTTVLDLENMKSNFILQYSNDFSYKRKRLLLCYAYKTIELNKVIHPILNQQYLEEITEKEREFL